MNKLVIVLLSIFVSTAYAANPNTRRVEALCEYRLSAKTATELLSELRKQVLAQTYLPSALAKGMSDLAIKKLAVDMNALKENASNSMMQLRFEREALDPIALRVFAVNSQAPFMLAQIALAGFPDPAPVAWQDLSLTSEQIALSHDELTQLRPLEEIDFDEPTVSFGFIGDVDADGARRFIYVSDRWHLIYGLDVPCADVAKYLTAESDADRLLTSREIFCRLPMIKFSRGPLKALNELPPLR